MNESLLRTIDSIDDIVMESEMNVCAALYDEYQKMVILLEYADEDVCEEMTIFQEAATKDTKNEKKETSSKKGNFLINGLKKLGGIIVKFFTKIGEKISKLFHMIKDGSKKLSDNFIYAVNEITGKNKKADEKSYQKYMNEINEIWESYNNEAIYLDKHGLDGLSDPAINMQASYKKMNDIAEHLIKKLDDLKSHIEFKSKKKSESKRSDIIDHIDECFQYLNKQINSNDVIIKRMSKSKDKEFNNEMKDFIEDFHQTSEFIKDRLVLIETSLRNLPVQGVATVNDNKEFAELIEVLLDYCVGMHLAKSLALKEQLQKAHIKSSLEDLNDMRNLSSVIGPIENVIFRDNNAYIKFMQTLFNKADKIINTFNVDVRGHFEVKIKDSRIDEIKFLHTWNIIPLKIYIDIHAKPLFLSAAKTKSEADVALFKLGRKIDNIRDLFDMNTNHTETEINKDLIKATSGPQLGTFFSNLTSGILSNDNINDNEKDELVEKVQKEIYEPYMQFASILMNFYTCVYSGIRDVQNIVYETHGEAWDKAPKNDVKDSDVFTMKDK